MTIRYTQPMRDVPSEERPRERLLRYGAEALATHELIAILLRTGTTKRHVLGVAEDLLTQLGGLRGIATAGVEELSRVDGVGQTKAIEICAAVELGKRIGALTEEARPTIRGPEDVAHLLMPELRYLKQEELRALLLDRRHRVLHVAKISRGSLTESISHPRDIFRTAIERNSAAVIVVHNHPSGDPTPSPEDIAATRRLVQVGELVGIPVLDHVIVGDGRYVSLSERGLV